jgi:RNA polymerase sigma-70 factor (ECF subfamily)
MCKVLSFLISTAVLFSFITPVFSGEITIETMPPSVIKTFPVCGDNNVDSKLNEIKVTFSKEMMTDKMWAWCRQSLDTFPELDKSAQTHYLKDKCTCVLPVKLVPGKTYVIWINRGRFNSFKDIQGNSAIPYLLVFKTKDK